MMTVSLRLARGLVAMVVLAMAFRAAPAQEPPAGGPANPPATPAPAPQPPPPAQGPPAPAATAHITYVTASSVYFDAGRLDGLWEGDGAQVVRDGAVVATLKVTNLSGHKAACSIVTSSATPAVGDLVRFVPRRVAGATSGAPAPAGQGAGTTAATGGAAVATTASTSGRRGTGLHGRVGVNYLYLKNGDGVGYQQPGVTLKLAGSDLGGAPIDVNLDVRTRRTYRTLPGDESQTYNQDWFYLPLGSYRPGLGNDRFTIGRQFAPDVAALNLFDGVLYDHQGGGWGAGLFSGYQPAAPNLGFSTTISEWGGYYRLRGTDETSPHQWSTTLGLVDSYEEGTVNREFLFVQAQYHGPALSAFMTEEVDYNRAWKVTEAGASTFSPTSTFVSLNYRPNDKVALFAGYDNRANVRLYSDRVTPVSEFDDSHRQGVWGGGWFHVGGHFLMGADARTNTGGPNGSGDSYSARLGVDGVGTQAVSIEGRGTRFTNDNSDGWLYSFEYGMNMGRLAHLAVSLGRLDETYHDDSDLNRDLEWLGIDLDVLISRTWFLILSAEKDQGSQEDNRQVFLGVSYRF